MREIGYYMAHAKVAGALRHMRLSFDLSQRELAELAGTSQAQVSKYEDPDYEGHKVGMLARMAGAVGWVFDPDIGPRCEDTVKIFARNETKEFTTRCEIYEAVGSSARTGRIEFTERSSITEFQAEFSLAGATT